MFFLYRLTSEDVDLLARDLTQKMFDEVVGHGEKLGGCRKTIILARNNNFWGDGYNYVHMWGRRISPLMTNSLFKPSG